MPVNKGTEYCGKEIGVLMQLYNKEARIGQLYV